MNRCNGSCNTAEDSFDRIELHVNVDVNLMVKNVTREKNGTMTSVNVKYQIIFSNTSQISSMRRTLCLGS